MPSTRGSYAGWCVPVQDAAVLLIPQAGTAHDNLHLAMVSGQMPELRMPMQSLLSAGRRKPLDTELLYRVAVASRVQELPHDDDG